MFRTVERCRRVRRAVAALEQRVDLEQVLDVPPVRMVTVPGFETAVFPYTTDIPFLSHWGEPLLFGPGSVHVAHTAEEFLSIAELNAAIDHNVAIARRAAAPLSLTRDGIPARGVRTAHRAAGTTSLRRASGAISRFRI